MFPEFSLMLQLGKRGQNTESKLKPGASPCVSLSGQSSTANQIKPLQCTTQTVNSEVGDHRVTRKQKHLLVTSDVGSPIVEYSLDLQNVNLTAIRTVRVLRPLKAINRVPSMRILVNLLLDTLPMLGNVLLLCFFVFFIFGIIGVQLWAGLLRNRCYLKENFTLSSLTPSKVLETAMKDVSMFSNGVITTGINVPRPYYMADEDDERPFICSLPVDNGIMSCTDVPARREGGRTCCLDKDDALYRQSLGLSPEPLANGSVSVAGLCVNWNQYYTRCHTGHSNPHKGAINFDNIAYAWIVIFQVITLEGWVEIMYYVMDAHSFYNFIYFILLIICDNITEEWRKQEEGKEGAEERKEVAEERKENHFVVHQDNSLPGVAASEPVTPAKASERLVVCWRRLWTSELVVEMRMLCLHGETLHIFIVTVGLRKSPESDPLFVSEVVDLKFNSRCSILLSSACKDSRDVSCGATEDRDRHRERIGSFFMINLCLVVIATQFSETKQREHQLMQEQRARCSSSSTLGSEPGDCYEALFQLVCHCIRKARRQTVALINTLRGKPRGFRGVGRGRGGGGGRERKANGRGGRERRAVLRHGPPCPHRNKPDHATPGQPMALTAAPASDGCHRCAAALALTDGVGPVRSTTSGESEEGAVEDTDREGGQAAGNEKDKKEEDGSRGRGGCNPKTRCEDLWCDTRMKLWGIVESKYFNRGIMIAILINTISMGIEHHEQQADDAGL
ncbi:unnamed protein product [Pleuronectes platessa]|uniref:Ion transport domain-containing protein n=1 Tax=Pleuronectes platessa TaxID=8262 RepID=A0A9N7VQN6_PLEPL|nr:unnamed protein product [Pleuronectes platessa]